MKNDLRNDLRLKLDELWGRETRRGVGRSMQVGGEAISGEKVKWRHLGTGIKMAARHVTRGVGRGVQRNPVKSLVGAAMLGGALTYGVMGNKNNQQPPTGPRITQGVPSGSGGGGIDEPGGRKVRKGPSGERTPWNFNRAVKEHLNARLDSILMEGSRGKRRLERLGRSKKRWTGIDLQARDRAALMGERQRAGLSPDLPPSQVQSAVLGPNGRFRVMSLPYPIDKYGNPVTRGEKPYRQAARVPKAVIAYRAASAEEAARGRAQS